MNLKEHQQRVVDSDGSKLVYHSLGSGKTLTGLAAIARAQKNSDKDALFIVPASLVNNIDKEIDKHKVDIDRDRLQVVSYDNATRNYESLANKARSILVLDEGHRIRNKDTKRYRAVNSIARDADRRLYLGASPIYSHTSDIATLINSVAQDNVLPGTKKDFINRYTREITIKPSLYDRIVHGKQDSVETVLRNSRELSKILNQYVDRYTVSKGSEDFPDQIDKTIKVPMSKEHEAVYNYAVKAIPGDLRKKVESGAALSRLDMRKLQAFMTGPRLAALGTSYIDKSTDISSKLDAAVSNLMTSHNNDPNFKAVVYSNFVEAGLKPYYNRLKEQGLEDKVQMFTGGISNKERKKIVSEYNKGNKPILLVSSAGTEGLDLIGTKKIQILEPHFNEEKIKQVAGRGNRYLSHAHLPEDERKLEVEHYISSRAPGRFNKNPKETVDEFLVKGYDKKRQLHNQILDLISQG